MTLKKTAFENTVRKGENAGDQHFHLFPQCFLPHHREIVILTMFNLSSANDFNLITSKILSFGLTHYHTMPHSEALKMYSCGKHYEKRRNCL